MAVVDREVAQGTRPRHSLLTDPDLADTWPRLTRGLAGFLRARGVQPCDVDDYIQESVQRAASKLVTYESAEELLAWCITVARNLVIDDVRRSARRGALPGERDTVRDVEADVLAKLAAFHLLDAFRALAAADRDAITTNQRGKDRTEANRLAQRRTRARRRLRDSLLIWLGGWGLALRRTGQAAPVTLVAAASLAAVVVLGGAVPPIPLNRGSSPHQSTSAEPLAEPVTLREVAPRTGSISGHPNPSQRLPIRSPSRAQTHRRVEVEPLPGQQGIYIEQRPATDADPLLCVRNAPIVGGLCTSELIAPRGGPVVGKTDQAVSIVG